jgi:hypothetical protein
MKGALTKCFRCCQGGSQWRPNASNAKPGAGFVLDNCERDRLSARHAPGEDVVLRGDQLDQHLVLAGREPGDVDCIEITHVRPLFVVDTNETELTIPF